MTDLTVRNNDFTSCSFTKQNYVIRINPMHLTDIKSLYHHNIKIYDNTFRKDTKKLIFMRAAENIEIYGNVTDGGKGTDGIKDEAFVFEKCENVNLKL